MSDHEDLHEVDVCPNEGCRAVESFDDGRCVECGFGICHGCLSEPVLIDRNRHNCTECGGVDHCDICGRPNELGKVYPLCTRCEKTARAHGRMQAEADRQLREFGGDPRGAKR